MASAMSKDPNLKVLIMNGYYDLATVFYGVEHTITHMNLAPEIKDNIIMTYYEAGHMMYIHEPSMKKFKDDLSNFIKITLEWFNFIVIEKVCLKNYLFYFFWD